MTVSRSIVRYLAASSIPSSRLIITFLLAILAMASVTATHADTCDGLSGDALGLCTGAVRAGCDSGSGLPGACAALERAYGTLGLGDPPWLAECPCDFSAVPMTQEVWDLPHSPFFQCPAPTGQTSVVADDFTVVPCNPCVGPESSVNILIFETPDSHLCFYSILADETVGHTTFASFNLTDAEAQACRRDVIAYGNALELVADSIGFTFFDNCDAPE